MIDVFAFAEKLHPVETYWGFNPSKRFWVPLALTDPAILSAILWVSDNSQARLNGQERPSGINTKYYECVGSDQSLAASDPAPQ